MRNASAIQAHIDRGLGEPVRQLLNPIPESTTLSCERCEKPEPQTTSQGPTQQHRKRQARTTAQGFFTLCACLASLH